MYNKIDFNKIEFAKIPYKKIKNIQVDEGDIFKSVYYIDIIFNNAPLYIQTPEFILDSIENDIVTMSINKEFYDTFVKKMEKFIVYSIYKYSEKWFGGKKFSIEKIIKCMLSNIIDENKLILLMSKSITFYDKYKNKLEINDIKELVNKKNFYTSVVCIIQIQNIQFIDNYFTCNFLLEQAKVINDVKLDEYSILDTDNIDNTDNTDNIDNNTEIINNVDDVDNVYNTDTSSLLDDEYYTS